MKPSFSFFLGALVAVLLLGGCSKTSTSESSSTQAQIPVPPPTSRAPFTNLNQFKDKPPLDLVKDAVIGKEIRTLVPQSQFKCMDDIFNYLRDLEQDKDGTLTSVANGSHADQFQESFVSVAPNGLVNIVLNCSPQSDPKGKFQYFTNQTAGEATPKPILDWIYTVGRNGDKVVKSDGKTMTEQSFEQFVQSIAPTDKPTERVTAISTPAPPKPVSVVPPEQPTQQARTLQLYVNQGATVCLDMYSMNKAIAIARAGNPASQLPDACVVMGASTKTRIVRDSTPIPGTVIIELKPGLVGLVDRNDLSMR